MVKNARRKPGGGTTREGMDGWTRERDNRFRELSTKKREGELTEEEQKEHDELEVDNEKFIEMGLKYHRGEGIDEKESLFLLLGYAIGLGNVWRYPYLAGKYGGLSFLLAYLVCLAMIAHPVYVIELAFGQTMKKSTFPVFTTINRKWGGVGYTSTYLLMVVMCQYTVLCAICFSYLAHSFADPLPWAVDGDFSDYSVGLLPMNMTHAEYYFHYKILEQPVPNETSGLGSVVWALAGWTFLAYALNVGAVMRGIKAEAKLTYFTVLASVVGVLLFTIRSLFLPGAWDGIAELMFRFDYISFFNPVMWAEAGAAGLFSVLLLPGTCISLASYLEPKQDIYKISRWVVWADTATTLVAALGVFAVIGHVADESCDESNELVCRSVNEVASLSGTSVTFVAIAEGLSKFGFGSTVFSVIFYFSLLTLAADTLFAGSEALVTNFDDLIVYFWSGKKQVKRVVLVVGIFVVLFLFSFTFTTQNGLQFMEIVQHYGVLYLLLLMSAAECLMAHEVGWDCLETQVQLETTGLKHLNNGRGRILPKHIKWCIKFFTPAMCVLFVLALLISDIFLQPPRSSDGGSFSTGFLVLGWVILVLGVLFLVLGGYCTSKPPPQLQKLFFKNHQKDSDGIPPLTVDTGASEIEEPLISNERSQDVEKGKAVPSNYTPPPGPEGELKGTKSKKKRPSVEVPHTKPSMATKALREEIARKGDAALAEAPMIDTDEEPDGTGVTAARRKELEAQGDAIMCEGSLVVSEEERTPRGTGVTDRMRLELEKKGEEVLGDKIIESESSEDNAGQPLRTKSKKKKKSSEVRVNV
eukprot:TRINITY_DN9957_c0_g1_i1.p1 TRINITY_DN9957_c0_g1~~TRINITY_DN9957_c0_g1_i1.p1  ORF type:complete len:811 (+),score=242.86 TRINITY_DN9957_c0_g1_i1:67-2499(+)